MDILFIGVGLLVFIFLFVVIVKLVKKVRFVILILFVVLFLTGYAMMYGYDIGRDDIQTDICNFYNYNIGERYNNGKIIKCETVDNLNNKTFEHELIMYLQSTKVKNE